MTQQLDVKSFVKVIPAKNKSAEKLNLLTKFIDGVQAYGDNGSVCNSMQYEQCDVAIIQGWTHEFGKEAPHLRLRQQIIETQIQNNKFVCTADSNLFLYANTTNSPHHYLRYSFNGVFRNTGTYFDTEVDPKRWQQISNDTGIKLEPMKDYGTNIILCLQRNGGWSLGKTSVKDWVNNTIQDIRLYSSRPIIIRPHPGDKRSYTYMKDIEKRYAFDKSVRVSYNRDLRLDLQNAYAVVNHNSSSIVGPIIQGYHAFITDAEKSQCAQVAHLGFERLENPIMMNRQKWLERISMFHWKFSELEDGSAWSHMRNYVVQ